MVKTIFYSLAALVHKILFCHSKIKFISSRHRVISSIYSPLQAVNITFSRPGYLARHLCHLDRQVNMADSCEWIFHLFGRHHCKFRVFSRKDGEFSKWLLSLLDQKTFQEFVFKAVKNRKHCGLLIASRSNQLRRLFFSKIKLRFLRQWWQLWMKSTEIKQRYRINFFRSVLPVCFTAELDE